jgi:predicted molibdopterin-dependent oxidoreductase YjgC
VILRDGLHDAAFVREETAEIDELARAVERFEPEYAARRAGVSATTSRLFSTGPM